jgi:hypothetical protein
MPSMVDPDLVMVTGWSPFCFGQNLAICDVAAPVASKRMLALKPTMKMAVEISTGWWGRKVRIPLILISHSGRSRSPIPVILITLFTMPEEGTADSMTWRWTATTDG